MDESISIEDFKSLLLTNYFLRRDLARMANLLAQQEAARVAAQEQVPAPVVRRQRAKKPE